MNKSIFFMLTCLIIYGGATAQLASKEPGARITFSKDHGYRPDSLLTHTGWEGVGDSAEVFQVRPSGDRLQLYTDTAQSYKTAVYQHAVPSPGARVAMRFSFKDQNEQVSANAFLPGITLGLDPRGAKKGGHIVACLRRSGEGKGFVLRLEGKGEAVWVQTQAEFQPPEALGAETERSSDELEIRLSVVPLGQGRFQILARMLNMDEKKVLGELKSEFVSNQWGERPVYAGLAQQQLANGEMKEFTIYEFRIEPLQP
jgi:hypothetical protein